MITPLLFVVALLSAADTPALNNAMPLHAAEGWYVDVGPGALTIGGAAIALADPVRLAVPDPGVVAVKAEEHTLPVFMEKGGGWTRGAKLIALVTQECTATGLLRPESVVVRKAVDGTLCTLDTDYALDGLWATIGRLEGGAIGENDEVLIDYTYGPSRLDSILVNEAGQVRLAVGTLGLGVDPPPAPGTGEYRIGSVWIPGNRKELAAESLFPVEFPVTEETPPEYCAAEQFLPMTLAKLEAGEPVTIVAWGDSVTAGGGTGGVADAGYQYQFHRRLQARFPKSAITLITAAWGGRGSRDYLEAPAGSEHDFERDVLAPKPDLVLCEWVNDAYLKDDALAAHYAGILKKLRGGGAEVVLLTPHLVRPDWMGVDSLKFDDDPRPYVQGLRRFAEANGVALADGSRHWCALWRQGIPYPTLLANSINHPDARGHALLADALMALFP